MASTDERLQEHGEHLARHDEQIKTLFAQQSAIKELTESTHSLAMSVEKLTTRVCSIETDIGNINTEKKQKNFALWQIVMSAIIGGGITFLITTILS